ncbi:hypothetical protein EGR_10757 [Echinococcus granulosus]|uniref:Uncharacterized protein n=1 Tax=Echinococcus granulosus TaxID=6210 RepID=W6ULG4_ECHGR|nr:hypothetical protein EGR_10757 [Echinococcus granulosus]EUB54379.1 hypothetical protein EGR_10757 [Echinococcus granulosus]
MDFRFRLRRKKPKQSPQLSPFASLKSISNEDLSNGSIYQRFFGPSTDLSKSSPEAPSEQLPPAPPISPITPSITSRASRISNALRDAVRMLRLGGDGHHQQQEEDTVTLEDANSSLPPSSGVASTAQPNLSASQTRLFRQQKRPMRGSGTMSAALGGVVKIGRRSKASTVSQDSGHCNTFEVTSVQCTSFGGDLAIALLRKVFSQVHGNGWNIQVVLAPMVLESIVLIGLDLDTATVSCGRAIEPAKCNAVLRSDSYDRDVVVGREDQSSAKRSEVLFRPVTPQKEYVGQGEAKICRQVQFTRRLLASEVDG